MITPIGNRLVIKPKETILKCGLDMPKTRESENGEGIVVAIGKGVDNVQLGDVVFYISYGIHKVVDVNGDKMVIIHKDDILGKKGV